MAMLQDRERRAGVDASIARWKESGYLCNANYTWRLLKFLGQESWREVIYISKSKVKVIDETVFSNSFPEC